MVIRHLALSETQEMLIKTKAPRRVLDRRGGETKRNIWIGLGCNADENFRKSFLVHVPSNRMATKPTSLPKMEAENFSEVSSFPIRHNDVQRILSPELLSDKTWGLFQSIETNCRRFLRETFDFSWSLKWSDVSWQTLREVLWSEQLFLEFEDEVCTFTFYRDFQSGFEICRKFH